MQKWIVFDGSEPRLALYSSLFSHFFDFRKRSKNRCQKGRQKLSFLVQNATLDAPRVDLSDVFGRFAKLRKIDDFSVSLWTSKSRLKIEPWGPKGRNQRSEPSPGRVRVGHFGHRGSQGGGHNQRYSKNINTNIEEEI